MAAGYYDANGIWHYGESDNIALFSDTLNKLANSTSSSFTADRSRIATLEAGALAGIIPVVPTSIVVASGTAAVAALGTVTFSGASNLQLNGCFSTLYKNYVVIINVSSSTNAGWLFGRFAQGGTIDTSTNINRTYAYNDSSSWSGAATGGADRFIVGRPNSSPSQASSIHNIFGPFESGYTSIVGQWLGGAGWFNGTSGAGYLANKSFDGFVIFPESGTITGSIQIFGYND